MEDPSSIWIKLPLYPLCAIQSQIGSFALAISLDSVDRWHQRLDHVYHSALNFLRKSMKVSMSNWEIEKLCNCRVRFLQFDGGGEYVSIHFQPYLSTNGITHRRSCPYTPSQNGLSECKICHLVETMRTLLLHAHMPPKFWPDALLTAAYINKQLPTSTLNFQTPFDTLFGSSPDNKSMRVFGCLCHPLYIPSLDNKLGPRSSPCVFIGYATTMKGYWCLDIKTRRVYTSRHVEFDETNFPFAATSASSTTVKANQKQTHSHPSIGSTICITSTGSTICITFDTIVIFTANIVCHILVTFIAATYLSIAAVDSTSSLHHRHPPNLLQPTRWTFRNLHRLRPPLPHSALHLLSIPCKQDRSSGFKNHATCSTSTTPWRRTFQHAHLRLL